MQCFKKSFIKSLIIISLFYRMNVFSKFTADFPDPPILAFLSQMSANDRLAAHQVCPSWFHRAREVNQTILPSLTIVVGDYTSPFEPMDDCLNLETLHAKSSVKLLYSLEKDNPNEVNTLFPFFPPMKRRGRQKIGRPSVVSM